MNPLLRSAVLEELNQERRSTDCPQFVIRGILRNWRYQIEEARLLLRYRSNLYLTLIVWLIHPFNKYVVKGSKYLKYTSEKDSKNGVYILVEGEEE